MLTCIIRYHIDPTRKEQFVKYARNWGQALGVTDRHVLAAPVAVMDKITDRPALVVRVLQGIQHELGLRGS